MAVAVDIPELAVVELTHELNGHPSGAVGVVIAADLKADAYTVELVDSRGRTADLVFARGDDLRVTHVV